MSSSAPSSSHANWPYPSPLSTPLDEEQSPVALGFLNPLLSPRQPGLSTSYPSEAPAGFHDIDAFIQPASMPPRPAIHNANHKNRKDSGGPQAQAGQSLTDSFIGAFDGTSLHDSFPTWQPTPEHPIPQMQTPPPTRDTPIKRASRPNPVPFTTPSTIRSRRHSNIGDDWLRRSVDQAPLEESPLQLTPLRFSPPDSQLPSTAPLLARNILWDPDSHQDPLFTSYSANAEDPFFSSSPVHSEQWPSGKPSNRFVNALPKAESLGRRRGLDGPPVRPHSVHLGVAPTLGPDRAARVASSVNPSMLWSNQGPSSNQLKISDPPSNLLGDRNVKQPYQYHFEELKRERELRQGKPLSSRSRAVDPMSLPMSSTMPQLRRSFTDAKARRSVHEGLFSTPESDHGRFAARTVPRHSSPLKRQRVDGAGGALASGASPTRKSISLTIDDRGHARAVVIPTSSTIQTQHRQDSALFSPEESESSDGDEMLGSQRGGGRRHKAQDALREMLIGRQQQQQQQQQQRKRVSTSRQNRHRATDSFALGEGLPAALAQDEASGARLAHAQDFGQNIRCICENKTAQAYMIQCESCRNWLHLECLAMGPEQAPQVYLCAFCTGHASEGAAAEHGSTYAMPMQGNAHGSYFGSS